MLGFHRKPRPVPVPRPFTNHEVDELQRDRRRLYNQVGGSVVELQADLRRLNQLRPRS